MSKKQIECPICEEDILKRLTIKIPGIGRVCPHHTAIINKHKKIPKPINKQIKPNKPPVTKVVENVVPKENTKVSKDTQTVDNTPKEDLVETMAKTLYKQIMSTDRKVGTPMKRLALFKQQYLKSPERLTEAEKDFMHKVFTRVRIKIKSTRS